MIAEQIDGFMTTEELDELRRYASRAWVIVEIGCWHGRSTHALAEFCPGVVHAVDWFLGTPSDPRQGERVRNAAINGEGERALESFLVNMEDFLLTGKVLLYQIESTLAARRHGARWAPIDLLFIDGSHDMGSLVADLEAWLPFVRPRGTVLLHDRDYDSVQAAVSKMGMVPMHNLAGTLWEWVKPPDADVAPIIRDATPNENRQL